MRVAKRFSKAPSRLLFEASSRKQNDGQNEQWSGHFYVSANGIWEVVHSIYNGKAIAWCDTHVPENEILGVLARVTGSTALVMLPHSYGRTFSEQVAITVRSNGSSSTRILIKA